MPPMDNQMPPIGEPDDMGTLDASGETPEGDMNGNSEGGAGNDVKKYSGELSQALNTYNEENPSDEEKVNKYAINMIAAQVADYLSDKDKRSVIKKLKGQEDDMSSDEQQQNDNMGGMPPMTESRLVDEIVNGILNDRGERNTKRNEKQITNNEVSKEDNPFVYK